MLSPYAKYSRLAKISDDEARAKATFDAIKFELSLPGMFNDIAGRNAAQLTSGVKVLGDRQMAARTPDEKQEMAYLQQEWAVTADTPNLSSVAGQIVSYFHSNMPEADLGWQQLFTLVDMRDSVQDHFEIIDTNLGITFTQQKAGAEIKIRRAVTDNATVVKYLTFADGIGILDDWIRFQKFWNVEQAVMEFQAKALDQQASTHYGLLTALSSAVNVTGAAGTADTVLLNQAFAGTLRKLRGKGYAASQNSGFVIVCAPEDVGRVTKMLTATAGTLIVAYQANVQPVNVHVSAVVASTYIPANTGGYYLVLPGRKMQRGNWKDLTVETARNIYARGNDWTGAMQFNAILGDQDQVARVMWA